MDKMMKILQVAVALAVFALGGCASGYNQFYKPENGITPELIAAMRVAPPPAIPLIERAPPVNGAALVDSYTRRGYRLIGSAMFNSSRTESEAAAVEQGKAVGADLVVILDPRYTGSESSVIPITTPTTSTTYSTGSATAYGKGGAVTAYSSGTSTTYGSTTNFIPITVHRTDYGAGYFVKWKFIIGANVRDLNDAERKSLQTNKGVVVYSVVDGSPAFIADILPDDILTSINGIPIANASELQGLILKYRGNSVVFGVSRNGRDMVVPVQLN